jgi:hypothetical protein
MDCCSTLVAKSHRSIDEVVGIGTSTSALRLAQQESRIIPQNAKTFNEIYISIISSDALKSNETRHADKSGETLVQCNMIGAMRTRHQMSSNSS